MVYRTPRQKSTENKTLSALKTRVSAVQPSRVAATDARNAPEGRAKRVHSAPGHHSFQTLTKLLIGGQVALRKFCVGSREP